MARDVTIVRPTTPPPASRVVRGTGVETTPDEVVGAPTNANYIVTATNASLTNERVLTAGTGISLTDGGAGSTLTIAATGGGGGGGAPVGSQYVTLATDGTLTAERVLTAGSGVTITDGGAGSTVTVSLATHTHTASQISDSTSVGRSILTAADAAAVRTAAGAAAATHTHASTDISDSTSTGRSVLTAANAAAARTAIGAAASAHTHTASEVSWTQTGTSASVRTVDAKLKDYVNAADFGFATGATGANNVTYLKAALATGKSVYMPPGTYPIATVTNQANTIAPGAGQTLFGDGFTTILSIDWTGTSSTDHFLFGMEADDVEYRDFVIDGNRWTGSSPFNLSDNTTFRMQTFKNTAYTKRKNFRMTNMKFVDMPAGYPSTDNNYNPGGQQILESLLVNGLTENAIFKGLKLYDCDQTFHILGGIGQGITNAAYWSNGTIINNFHNSHSTTFARGQWVGLGLYGARDTTISNVYVQGARLAGLNLEWADRATVQNVTIKDTLRAGIQFFGGCRDLHVDRPVLDNCGAAFSAPYAFDSTAAPIRFSHGEWFENGIAANPSRVHVYLPRFSNIPAYTTGSPGSTSPYPVYAAYSTAANLSGAIEGEPRNLRITIDEEALRIAGNAAFIVNSSGLQPMGVNVVLEGLGYGAPVTVTAADSNMSSAVTKAVSGFDTYYSLTSNTQYQRIAFNLGVSGIFAMRGKIKYTDASDWNIAVSPIDGGTVRWQSTFDRDVDDWVDFGAVFQTAEASSVKIINIKAGTASCQIKDLQIACLERGTSGDADFMRIDRGKLDAIASAVPSATRYVVGDLVYNTAPGRQSPMFWVNTTAGSPGTFDRAPTLESITSGITATGTVQGDAYGLGTDVARRVFIDTVAAGTGVRLPTTPQYALTTIYNRGANTLNVWPGSGGSINNAGTDAAVTIASHSAKEFFAVAANTWRTVG
jgi:hypothetical protein